MQDLVKSLRERLQEVYDLRSAAAVLEWDQLTYMPPGGAAGRSRQLATLGRLAQEKFTDPAIGEMLEALRPYEESLPFDSDEAALVRVTRREYERAVRLPPDFVAELFAHASESYQVWTEARPSNDFARVRPYLERTLELSRRMAQYYGDYEHIADPLIEEADYGMTVAQLRPLFAELRGRLVPLVEAIAGQPAPADDFLYRAYPEDAQWDFGLDVVRRYGYDLRRGRQDPTAHPFTTRFSWGDVRITTHIKPNDLADGLYSTLHEAGHGMYEQGINPDYDGTPLASGTSAGVHESQSRLWENVVGRSLAFWRFCYPKLQATFPEQLGGVSLEAFYRAINKVQPGLIRINADEVTYNLHIIVRFELELDLLEGSLAVQDLPEAWHARYQDTLGIRAPDDQDGVLQDVHWYGGVIGGAFQGYTLGNILAAAFWQQALAAYPEIPEEIARGEFGSLHSWMREHIYRHGSKYTAPELVQRVTGAPLSIEPYMSYLQAKFGQLYGLA